MKFTDREDAIAIQNNVPQGVELSRYQQYAVRTEVLVGQRFRLRVLQM